jgi:hypothetical protein
MARHSTKGGLGFGPSAWRRRWANALLKTSLKGEELRKSLGSWSQALKIERSVAVIVNLYD